MDFFQFQLTPNPPNSFNINLGFGILNYTNVTIVASTEVENFCFIPLQSALDYSRGSSQEHDVLIDGTDTINARTPFDAVVARGWNRGHLAFNGGINMPDHDPPDYPRPWVNGEIGDNEIWLDNQTVNRRAHYEGRSNLIAGNEVGIIHRYPNSFSFEIPTSASKDKGFLVSADSGRVTFQSAQVIRLRQGFVAEQGSEFRAYIDNMQYLILYFKKNPLSILPSLPQNPNSFLCLWL